MRKLVSNSEIMKLFKDVEEIKKSEADSSSVNKQIKQIHDQIIDKLSFLVYYNAKQYKKFPNYEDLVQEGFVGLIRAVKKFEHWRFPNFFVFADQWIRHSIKRSASRFDVVYNPNRSRVIYSEFKDSEVQTDTGLEDDISKKDIMENVERILGNYSSREREIVQKVFGLNDCKDQTLREIGPQFNLTHERVRQIKNNVIRKLRRNLSEDID